MTHATPSPYADPSGVRRRLRQRLLLCWAVALPPLCALLLVVATMLLHRQRPVQTGDALLDAFVQALAAQGSLLSEKAYASPAQGGGLPADKWGGIEQRFEDDPRYYVLRFQFEPSAETYLSPVAQVQLDSTVRHLEDARVRKVADWQVLLYLARWYDGAWREEAEDKLGLPRLKQKATGQQRYERAYKLRQQIDLQHSAAADALYVELEQAGAKQALVWYFLARIACERGQYDRAAQYLHRGNKAPQNDGEFGYPFDILRIAAAQGQPLGGDEVLSGYLCMQDIASALPNYIVGKEMVRIMCYQAVDRGDKQTLRELHQFACRYGSARGAPMIQSLVGSVCDGFVLDAASQLQLNPSARTAQARSEAGVIRGKLKASVKGISGAYNFVSTSSVSAKIQLVFDRLATGGYGTALTQQEMLWQGMCIEYAAQAGPIKQLFDQSAGLELFD